MNKEEIEELFANINMVEDQIQQLEEVILYDYAVFCITNMEWASSENYKDFLEAEEEEKRKRYELINSKIIKEEVNEYRRKCRKS